MKRSSSSLHSLDCETQQRLCCVSHRDAVLQRAARRGVGQLVLSFAHSAGTFEWLWRRPIGLHLSSQRQLRNLWAGPEIWWSRSRFLTKRLKRCPHFLLLWLLSLVRKRNLCFIWRDSLISNVSAAPVLTVRFGAVWRTYRYAARPSQQHTLPFAHTLENVYFSAPAFQTKRRWLGV